MDQGKDYNGYFFVSHAKELIDSYYLSEMIKESKWVDKNTIIVNCSPDYSSGISQFLNHKLSHLNDNEQLEQINLEMPYPNMSQIWDPVDLEYKNFDFYLKWWVNKYIRRGKKYLFTELAVLRGKNFNKTKLSIRDKLDPGEYGFCCLYLQSTSIFTPDFFVEKFDFDKQGGLLMEWENINNPNWNY